MSDSALATFRFDAHTCIPWAQPKAMGPVTLESPGIEVMTDLAKVRAATTEPGTTLAKAEKTMINQGVRSLLVISNFPCVDGLVTASDLHGDLPMRLVSERHVLHEDLCAADVMTALPNLDALDYDELKKGTIRNVIATFKQTGRSHLLVVQAASVQGPARIRGLISRTQLERQLGSSIA